AAVDYRGGIRVGGSKVQLQVACSGGQRPGVELAADPLASAVDLGDRVVGGLGEPRLVAAGGEARRRVLPGAGVDEDRFAVAGHDHAARIEMVVRFVVVAPFDHHA